MCCCTNSQDVFTWIGAIIVNIAFMTIITMSSEQNTWIGCLVCFVYVVVLYKLAQFFEERNKRTTAQILLSDEEETNEQNDTPSVASSANNSHQQQEPTAPLIVSVFYGLSILALGVTGVLLAFSLVPESCDDEDDYDVCQKGHIRKQALINIFTSIAPMIAASVSLWQKKSIPSTGVTTYFAITLFGSAIIAFIDPYWEGVWADTVYRWWITLTSLAWMLILSYRSIASNDLSAKNSLSWGINISALAFFFIMFIMVEIQHDTFLNWFLLNILSFIPLIIFGLVIEHNFIIFLGVIGLLIDIWRLTLNMAVVLQFVVFGVAGIGVVALGSWLKTNQDLVRQPCLKLILGTEEVMISGYQNASENTTGTNHMTSSLSLDTVFCCIDSQEIFTWIGAIIINIAFITIISVTVETNIIISFLLSLSYTILLFKMAEYFGKKKEDDEDEDENSNESTTTMNEKYIPTAQGIFYGLSILALGTSGFLLSLAINAPVEEDEMLRRQAITNIFVTILPMGLGSSILWFEKSIPSCGLTLYLSIVLFGTAITLATDPGVGSILDITFYRLWLFLTSLVWTLTLSFKYLLLLLDDNSSTKKKKESFSWAINFGSFVFFGIMFNIVQMQNDTIWNWLMINIFSFIPLIILGMVLDHNFIVFLGVLGFFIDIIRLTNELGDQMMLRFVLLGISGLGVVALGSWLKTNQDVIRDPILKLVDRVSGSRRRIDVGSTSTTSQTTLSTSVSTTRGTLNEALV